MTQTLLRSILSCSNFIRRGTANIEVSSLHGHGIALKSNASILSCSPRLESAQYKDERNVCENFRLRAAATVLQTLTLQSPHLTSAPGKGANLARMRAVRLALVRFKANQCSVVRDRAHAKIPTCVSLALLSSYCSFPSRMPPPG